MIKLLLLAVIPFLTEHRLVSPKTFVTTNFYGSVTGVVTKTYVEGLGIEPVDTQAVIKAANDYTDSATGAIRRVDGTAKILPKYLWCRDFYDSYTNDAAWYYAQPQDYGHCSAMRNGDFLYRNLDWKFNDAADVIVRMFAGEGRFASIGVANCGTNLTEAIITSGKPSRYYKCLPGHTTDGINENGVCAEVNVVDGDPQTSGWHTTGNLHPLAAVRWVLDHATNAQHGATYIAANIHFPEGWSQNFHYMICDKDSTYIVENGSTNGVIGKAVMTNFRLYPTHSSGEGQERYDMLVDGADITSVWWTLTYTAAGYRASDLPGITGSALTQLFNYWENNPRESHRGETFGDVSWWQTVHTSIYDLKNLTLKISVQETDDWYVFLLPSVGKVKSVNGKIGEVVLTAEDVHALPETYTPPVQPTNTNDVKAIVGPMIGDSTNGIPERIAALQDGKRDKTDDKAYELQQTGWGNWYSEYSLELASALNANGAVPVPYVGPYDFDFMIADDKVPSGWSNARGRWESIEGGIVMFSIFNESVGDDDVVCIKAVRSIEEDTAHKLAKRMATPTSGALAKFDADGNLVNVEDTDERLLTAEQRAEIAKVSDKADEYGTTWIPQNLPNGVTLYGQPVFFEEYNYWQWDSNEGLSFFAFDTTEDAKELHFKEIVGRAADFDAILPRVLRKGDAVPLNSENIRIGTNSVSDGVRSVAVGANSQAHWTGSVAIGASANAHHSRAIVIGNLAGSNGADTFNVSSPIGYWYANNTPVMEMLQNRFVMTNVEEVVTNYTKLVSAPKNGNIVTNVYTNVHTNTYTVYVPDGTGARVAYDDKSSLARMMTDAATNHTEECECISTNICKLAAPAITNAIIHVRDRFYDEELDVTWKRTVNGGRIFYDIEAVGNSTED